MPGIMSEAAATQYPLIKEQFQRQQVAGSLSAVAMNVNENRATSGTLQVTGIVMPYPGSIIGVTASLSGNVTAGVLTLDVTINGTATGFQALIPGVYTLPEKRGYSLQEYGVKRFQAGDTIGVKITTDGSYAPTTLDLLAEVLLVLDQVYY
jgi:hypothetical protein